MNDLLGTNSSRSSNSTNPMVLPASIEAFAPFILLELVVAVVSNLILIALVVKVSLRDVQNNTNVYLFSLGIAGLLQSFNLLTLLITVLARKWVLGGGLCTLNSLFIGVNLFGDLLLHLVISRDRYKAVRDPFHWQPKTKRAYIFSTVIWAVSLLYALLGLIHQMKNPRSDSNIFTCFSLTSVDRGEDKVTVLGLTAFFSLLYYLMFGVVTIITLTHYILVFKEIHHVEKLRTQHRMLSDPVLKVNGRDKPLECTSEERAAKSLGFIFLIQFGCSLVSNTLTIARMIQAPLHHTTIADDVHPAEIIVLLCIDFLPAVNPAVLILTNKRFRNRVKELFKCELKPTTEIDETAAFVGPRHQSIKLPRGMLPTPLRYSIFVRKKNNETTSPEITTRSEDPDTTSLYTITTPLGSFSNVQADTVATSPRVRSAWLD